jgi:pimeloyl-ACP methyl ester carboxylesterase
VKLNYHVAGQGTPLLILHGLLGSLDNWMPHAQQLAPAFQVFLLDLRNHGRSPHTTDFNYDLMASDIATFVQEHQLGAVNVLGHSMGGKVAMRFAQVHPERTRKLVVADMAPREYPPRYAEMLNAMHTLDLSQFQQRPEVDAALARAVPDPGIRQFLLKNIGRDPHGHMRWKPNVAALRENYHSIRGALPTAPPFLCPTLFIRGGKSDYIRDQDLPQIQQLFPRAKLETIPAAGHWIHAEAPEEFLRLVTTFLQSDVGD